MAIECQNSSGACGANTDVISKFTNLEANCKAGTRMLPHFAGWAAVAVGVAAAAAAALLLLLLLLVLLLPNTDVVEGTGLTPA